MAIKKGKLNEWRKSALDLYLQGLEEYKIIERILKKYKREFVSNDSGKRSIKRFLHSEQVLGKKKQSFDEAVEETKRGMHDKAAKARERERVMMKAATDIIIDGVLGAIDSREYYTPNLFEGTHNHDYSEETIVLMISDIQAGTYVSKEATGGLNEYSWEIIEKQFKMLFYGLEEIVKRHKMVAPINDLHIHLLGDIVEGWDIFTGQTQNIDRDIIDQTIGVIDLLVDFLDRTRTLFRHIHVVGVPGNHGRIGKKGENPHYVNFDYLIYRIIEKMLKNFPEFTWQFTKSWWQIDTIYGYNFFLIHGDDIKAWNGLPYYGIDRAARSYREMLELLNRGYNYLEMGHFHVPTELSGVTVEKFVNGCWPGGSIYSMKGLGTANTPVQKLFAVHPKQGVTYRYPIRLLVKSDD